MDQAEIIRQTATPALFARWASRGKWKLARHLLHLDRALTDTITGTDGIRRLLVTMPPRHGKSELCSKYLPAWFLGTFPDRRVILASYEADFAASWGRKARSLLEEHGRQVFGVGVASDSRAVNRWDIAERDGGMMTAGVGGPITGKGAHLLICDDPIKNAEEAGSPLIRQKAWDWWQSTAYTRLEPGGAVIGVQTRWNEDDWAGRVLLDKSGETWRVIDFPAIAERSDALGRQEGEALWPDRFPIGELRRIEKAIGSYWWSALYQQRPAPREGGMFKREWLRVVDSYPREATKVVRWWDKAATEGAGDYTAGVKVVEHGGLYYVADVTRGQWSSGRRDDVIDLTASVDWTEHGDHMQIWMEQEPGSGGKQSAEISVRNLRGYRVRTERSTGSKVDRADAFASQCQAGNVRMVRGSWNQAFSDELCSFPNGAHDDQVDAAAGAFNKLANRKSSVTLLTT